MLVLRDSNLSLKNKTMVYWTMVFLVCCYMDQRHGLPGETLKEILGITAQQQSTKSFSDVQMAKQFGMEESIEDLITKQ